MCLLLGGCLLPGGSALGGGGVPACTEADTPPVNRITDACKNMALAHFVAAGKNTELSFDTPLGEGGQAPPVHMLYVGEMALICKLCICIYVIIIITCTKIIQQTDTEGGQTGQKNRKTAVTFKFVSNACH